LDLFDKYNLTRVINACGKMTSLSGAMVRPEVIAAAAEAMGHFFVLDELHAAAGRVIAHVTGAESGCVTACSAAGITLGVAACMTGNDIAQVWQLPDTSGMPHRVLIQKGHCVNYGQPVTQAIRLSGASVAELGTVDGVTPAEIKHELSKGGVASFLFVKSHHTVQHGCVPLPEVVAQCHTAGVPVIVDGAAQDHQLCELLATGADLVIVSAHKFLCSTTGGVVAGRKDLVDALYLQNQGIGRPMKAGKEAIIGAMAALEYRQREDIAAWTAEQDRKVGLILELLQGIPGLALQVDPDPSGCPFSRVRLTPDPKRTGYSAASLEGALIDGNPTVVPRAHHTDEGYLHLDAIDLTDADLRYACDKVRVILARAP
jgi:L-seryl-tRNA(Ser) seleniumtransferase